MKKKRKCHGQELAEFGPTLFVIFILLLFPALGLLYFLAAYSAGWYFNHMMVRELSVTSFANWATVETNKVNLWNTSSLKSFTGTITTAALNPAPMLVASSNPNSPQLVKVTTNINIPSFVNIPFFNTVPGLGQPIPMKFTEEYPQQNPD